MFVFSVNGTFCPERGKSPNGSESRVLQLKTIDRRSRPSTLNVGEQLLLASLALSSGAALVIAIKARVSLGLTLACLGVMAATMFRLRWVRSNGAQQADIKARAWTGFVAGTIATAGYDL